MTTSTYGYAAGLDYHYSPDTVFGFSLAGGGTNWNLAQVDMLKRCGGLYWFPQRKAWTT